MTQFVVWHHSFSTDRPDIVHIEYADEIDTLLGKYFDLGKGFDGSDLYHDLFDTYEQALQFVTDLSRSSRLKVRDDVRKAE